MGNRWWIELETPDGGKAEMMELTPCGTGCKLSLIHIEMCIRDSCLAGNLK